MSTSTPTAEQLTVYFDGDCPLCTREVAMVERKDKAQSIRFVDIAAPHFEAHPEGPAPSELMAEIHARLPNGTFIKGVEVFRQMYGRLGYRIPVALTRVWGIRQVLDGLYLLWARNRLALTGRRCDANVCERPPERGSEERATMTWNAPEQATRAQDTLAAAESPSKPHLMRASSGRSSEPCH